VVLDNGNLRGVTANVEKLLGSIVGVEIHVPVGNPFLLRIPAVAMCWQSVGNEQDDVALA